MDNGTRSVVSRVEHGLSFEQMKERASLLVKSGFLPTAINTSEKALTIMLTGQELGLGFMESLRSINVIQGKPCLSAQLLLGLCYRTGQVEQAYVKESTDLRCVYVLKRKGNPEAHVAIFSADDARKMGLMDKDNYKKQPKTMFEWRAISAACRKVFPDAICGLYTPEEIADGVDVIETQTGEVAISEVYEKKEEKTPETKKIEAAAIAQTENLELDQIGNYKLQAPWNMKYGDMTLMQIVQDKTPTGFGKGEKYLESVATKTTDPYERQMVSKFLEKLKELV